ncbi:MAG: hypothetical protein ABUS79_02300 [Pseudomonadota bacterium]
MPNASSPPAAPVARRLLLTCALLSGVAVSWDPSLAAAAGPLAHYAGIHPLNPHMGAFCVIEVPHVHAEWPPDIRVYRTLPNKTQVFVGDPVALGYDGPTQTYFGPHPLVFHDLSPAETIYCYLRGPHHHTQPPEPPASFVKKDGVNWFVGTFPPEFDRDYSRNDWINEVRGIGTYQPPKVDIAAAPPGYHLPAVLDTQAVVPVVAPAANGGAAGGKKSRKPGGAVTPVTPPPPPSKGVGKASKPADKVSGAAPAGNPAP